MQAKYTKETSIQLSQIDPLGRLSVPETFDLFMNTAAEAAEALGIGIGMLRTRGLFWLTVKTRVEFIRRPMIGERVTVSTWPDAPGDTRCERHYAITGGGETLVKGKTEWAIADMRTGRPQNLAGIMPEGLAYDIAPACPEPFPMIDDAFPEPPFAEHRVQTLDIDMARHMNNVAYVRAIVNAFSVKAWLGMDVRRMDIIFRASAREGDVLSFQKRISGDTLDIRGSLPGGETSVMARLILREQATGNR